MEGQSNVIKLEGARNWNIWKFQTTVLLRGNGWLDIVEGRTVKPEEAKERTIWETKDAKAQTLLVTRMSEEVMLHIITCTTSAEMWRKLLSVYEQKSETSVHIIQQRFFQYKYEKGVDMSTFVSKIKYQEMQNQLKQMGEGISDKLAITKILMSLPDEFKHFVSAWESAPDDKQTFDNLVARLLIEEERVKEKSGEFQETSTSSAFVAKKNVKCFTCGKTGHYQAECRSNKKHEERSNNNKCFYCGKFGHFKAQCRFKRDRESKKTSNAFVVSSSKCEQSRWLVDSGASEHMCCDRTVLKSFSSTSAHKSVIIGNGAAINVSGCGQMAVQVFDGTKWIDTTIDNVLYVPELKTNLFSVNRATDKGYVMMTDDSSCKFYKNGVVRAIANRAGNSYYMDFRIEREVSSVAKTVEKDLNEWHERLAHQNFDRVKKVLQENNIAIQQTSVPECVSCLEGKIHRLPFKKRDTCASERTCEIIHGDTCGPMEVTSIGGSRYFVVLKDDYSNYRSVYFVKAKSEIQACLEDFINKAENITGNKVKTFRSDNGLEFVNGEIKEMFSRRGITHQLTVPYTPEQNGKAERENRTLVEAARTMLHAKNLPKKLWAEAVNTAAFVLNRTAKSRQGDKTPFEVWTKKNFDIHQLKAFGSPVIAHIPKEKRRKWDKKGEKGLMVGYGDNVKGYRIYFAEKNNVETKRDVVFLNQEGMKHREMTVTLDLSEQPTQESITQETVKEKEVIVQEECLQVPIPNDTQEEESFVEESESHSEYEPCSDDSSEPEVTMTTERSRRVRKQTSFYKCNTVMTEESEPVTYREAMKRRDSSKWSEAIQRELQTLKDNNT